MKKRINITLSPDAVLLLKHYAQSNHITVSAAIENWVWTSIDRQVDTIPGQFKLKGVDEV